MNAPYPLSEEGVWAERLGRPGRPAPGPALFLDRDGVLLEEVGYLHEPAEARLLPGAAAIVARANRRGLAVVVVTNQSGIGRGYYDWAAFAAVQAEMLRQLAGGVGGGGGGGRIDAVFAAPFVGDHPDRKPAPGMLLRAQAMLDLDLAASWIVGDRASDLAAARSAGLAGGVLVPLARGDAAAQPAAARALAGESFQVIICDSVAAAGSQVPLLREV